MKIRFLQDYRGKLTGEFFYVAGTEIDLPNGQALVDAGRAEPVGVAKVEPDPAPEADVAPAPKPRASRSRKK